MKKSRNIFILAVLLLAFAGGCRQQAHRPRSPKSFDEICSLVAGKSAMEVRELLGPPDNRKETPIGDQRWIWWDYTFLAGDSYSPEIRGKTVHLEITFSHPLMPAKSGDPLRELRVNDALAVSYVLPQSRL